MFSRRTTPRVLWNEGMRPLAKKKKKKKTNKRRSSSKPSKSERGKEVQRRWGLLVKGARVRAGLSRKQLSQSLGIHSQTVYEWERGNSFPDDLSHLTKLESVLDSFNPCSALNAALKDDEWSLWWAVYEEYAMSSEDVS